MTLPLQEFPLAMLIGIGATAVMDAWLLLLKHLGVPTLNFAFIGQFAESKQRDCIFTTEYSVRTPMEAVYTLLNVERGVPEVFNSTYDIRTLLSATGRLRDGKEIDIPGPAFLRNMLMNRLDKTQIGALLREFGLVTSD